MMHAQKTNIFDFRIIQESNYSRIQAFLYINKGKDFSKFYQINHFYASTKNKHLKYRIGRSAEGGRLGGNPG